MKRRLVGAFIDHWNAEAKEVLVTLRNNQPDVMIYTLITEGVWGGDSGRSNVQDLLNLVGPNVTIILRDTYQWLGGDGGVKTMLYQDPITLGTRLGHAMSGVQDSLPPHPNYYLYDMNEVLVHTSEQRKVLIAFTKAFMGTIHARGKRGIGLNNSWGTPNGDALSILRGWEELKEAYDVCDRVGPHMYRHVSVAESDPAWSCYRYRFYPKWFDRGKAIFTEVGYEEGGWVDFITEYQAKALMELMESNWADDGVEAVIYYLATHRSVEWDKFKGTSAMWQAFSRFPIRESGEEKGDVAVPQDVWNAIEILWGEANQVKGSGDKLITLEHSGIGNQMKVLGPDMQSHIITIKSFLQSLPK